MSIGLYIHIPFCKTRCHYCDFVTTADASAEQREKFFDALKQEIQKTNHKYGRLCFDTLYLGGGTPSSLSVPEINKLSEMFRTHFMIREGAEVTCEWNPGDQEDEKLAAFIELGVNRISLGVQSFQDVLLTRIGRRHSARDILKALEKIRKAKIVNISFDLMLRIPGQTVEDFRQSLERCVELKASQVSLYDLEVHDKTVLGRLQKQGKLDFPDEEAHAQMYQAAIDVLTGAGRHGMLGEPRPSNDLLGAGYDHYEISNFAKPGAASQHNLIYWHNQEYLGLGPSAFSYLDGTRYQFAGTLDRYLEKAVTGDRQNDQEDVLSEVEKETETFIMELRLREGVVPGRFPKIGPLLLDRIETLCREGLMERFDGNVRLTDRGKFLSEDVFGFLLQKAIDTSLHIRCVNW